MLPIAAVFTIAGHELLVAASDDSNPAMDEVNITRSCVWISECFGPAGVDGERGDTGTRAERFPNTDKHGLFTIHGVCELDTLKATILITRLVVTADSGKSRGRNQSAHVSSADSVHARRHKCFC